MALPKLAGVPVGSEVDPCCCDLPEDCCLYPWPDPDGTPLYPATDLPDTVVGSFFGGGEYTSSRSGYEYYFSGTDWSGSHPDYVWTPIKYDGISADIWGLYYIDPIDGSKHYASNGSLCGIVTIVSEGNPDGYIHDEFAGTYLVTDEFANEVTVTRQSLCEWTGIFHADIGDVTWRLFYDDGAVPSAFNYKWRIDLGGSTATKDDPQSSPVGEYKILGSLIVTVS